jgi:hypothetical protein
MADMKVDLPHLSKEPDRHGNLRLYVRRHGRRIRLRIAVNDPCFLEVYQKALVSLNEAQAPSSAPVKKIAARGTLGWLAARGRYAGLLSRTACGRLSATDRLT